MDLLDFPLGEGLSLDVEMCCNSSLWQAFSGNERRFQMLRVHITIRKVYKTLCWIYLVLWCSPTNITIHYGCMSIFHSWPKWLDDILETLTSYGDEPSPNQVDAMRIPMATYIACHKKSFSVHQIIKLICGTQWPTTGSSPSFWYVLHLNYWTRSMWQRIQLQRKHSKLQYPNFLLILQKTNKQTTKKCTTTTDCSF